jgi:hypothetical protein
MLTAGARALARHATVRAWRDRRRAGRGRPRPAARRGDRGRGRANGQNPAVAVAREASLDAREEHAGRAAVGARREEPEPVPTRDEQREPDQGATGARALLSGPERRQEQAAGVNGCREPEHDQAAGITAAELAQRASSGNHLLDVPAADLERWLLTRGLAARNPSGLLVPTALGVELGGALGPR